VTLCEFFDDVALGTFKNGVQCQDVQRLTFANESFDVCTSTEVMEHVPDDAAGFAELYRVLKPGGLLVFTVPLTAAAQTIERAMLMANGVAHLLPPEYHGDRVRGANKVLCYRNYGQDILARVAAAGFCDVRFYDGNDGNDGKYGKEIAWFGYGRLVIVAQKSA
jgi:SAM-dependent methyltransferase